MTGIKVVNKLKNMEQPTWVIAASETKSRDFLSSELNIHPVVAQVLVNRGITDTMKAHDFLSPSLAKLPDPFLLPDMEKAVSRISEAIEKNERITIYGDYDVDGITSTAILQLFFDEIGIKTNHFIPHRVEHGYGLHVDAIKELKKTSDLLITVDTGSRDYEAIDEATKSGIDVIITDHHTIDAPPKGAIATINPKRADSRYPYHELAGCGVAFCLLMALRKHLREKHNLKKEPNLKGLLDLVALATIADIVPLTGANRVLTKIGLEIIKRGKNPGIAALINVSGLENTIDSYDVAYRIAPRINAAGRIENATIALKLLLSEDIDECREIASKLNDLNLQRQQLENKILKDADFHFEKNGPPKHAIAIHNDNWHLGVMGIAASKLARNFNLPAAIISKDSKGWMGSVRSAQGIDIIAVLNECSDLLARFGGHKDAAGITIDDDKLLSFKDLFLEKCKNHIPEKLPQKLEIEAKVKLEDISERLISDLQLLEPFGEGNPEPIFYAEGAEIASARVVGKNHLKLTIKGTKTNYDAIGFGLGDKLANLPNKLDLAFIPQFNYWQGSNQIQLKIITLKL